MRYVYTSRESKIDETSVIGFPLDDIFCLEGGFSR